MNNRLLFGIICTIILCPSLLHAQKKVQIFNAQGVEQILYRQSHALLIGASDYTAGWPDLPGVKEDIAAVEKILKEHNFSITKILNPDKQALNEAFEKFIRDYGLDEENRLLVYFAGHGYTLKKKYGEEMGYIVPVDAPNPHNDEKGFISKAMPIERIELFAKRIDAKHALFIFDSCFSGSIFSLSRAIPASITDKTSKPVRQFITSGDADEEVPDISVFSQQFISALSGDGDSNRDGYLTGSELGSFLTDTVINYSKNTQHPQYGKIRNPHLNKGDFVFILPQKKLSVKAVSQSDKQKTSDTALGEGGKFSEQAELMFWDTIKNSSNPADFKAYLEQFPHGKFAGLARIRSGKLDSSVTSKPAIPEKTTKEAARIAREQEEARKKRAEAARIAREQEEARKKRAEAARIAREQEEARKKRAEAARIAREQEEARKKRAEAARIAREQEEARKKRAEAARIAREQEEARKKREILSQYNKVLSLGFKAVEQNNREKSQDYYNQARQLADTYKLSRKDLRQLEQKIKSIKKAKKKKRRIISTF
ncbi:MAG: caspase family protein [Candidatus Electrothrix sp. GW3-4]|uniref:caspase family protein n=1 Tax=Candidatus Electrothrix sp. GW3-4 TaxID=3126740 RepID=UPI0030CED1C9